MIPSNCVTGVVIDIRGSIAILFSLRIVADRLREFYLAFPLEPLRRGKSKEVDQQTLLGEMNSVDGEMPVHSPRGGGCVVSEDGHLRFAVQSSNLTNNDASPPDGVGLTLTIDG